NAVCDLLTGALINLCRRGPGNIHPLRALLMSQLLQIDQPDHLVFVYCEGHGFTAGNPVRHETAVIRFRTDSSASSWSCHSDTSVSFPSYVENNIAHFSEKCNSKLQSCCNLHKKVCVPHVRKHHFSRFYHIFTP